MSQNPLPAQVITRRGLRESMQPFASTRIKVIEGETTQLISTGLLGTEETQGKPGKAEVIGEASDPQVEISG